MTKSKRSMSKKSRSSEKDCEDETLNRTPCDSRLNHAQRSMWSGVDIRKLKSSTNKKRLACSGDDDDVGDGRKKIEVEVCEIKSPLCYLWCFGGIVESQAECLPLLHMSCQSLHARHDNQKTSCYEK